MKKILITGANSYIGDSVRDFLLKTPDKYLVDIKDTIDWTPDISDFVGYDVVFNVAGIAHKKETKENRHLYFEINRDLVVNIAKNAKKAGVHQFILLSSMSVYGMEEGYITKDTIENPKDAYGKSKAQADEKIFQLEEDSFVVACLRPPMVYGRGCKGNYQRLRRFALHSPVFPDYNNERSMIYIGNLCSFIKKVIDGNLHGVFFPQNKEYINTSKMVKAIADFNGGKIKLVKGFNPIVKLCRINIFKKVFGSLTYEKVDAVDDVSFEDSIDLAENVKLKNTPLVTILTVAFNSEKTIAKTIDAVFNQTYPNIEYIIIDGASTDNTVQVAKSYQSLFDSASGRSLKIISESDNGMYDALNKGARMAQGKLVGQTNADDWYEPDAVETMVKLFAKKRYDVAWGSIRVKKPSGDMIKHAKIGMLWTTNGWCHPAMFSKRKVLLQFPYACESMYDDFDYITAVKKAGKKIVTTDHVISNFSFGGMSTQKSLKEVKKRVDILYKVYRKHGFSRFYYIHRWIMEMAKYILG